MSLKFRYYCPEHGYYQYRHGKVREFGLQPTAGTPQLPAGGLVMHQYVGDPALLTACEELIQVEIVIDH